MDDASAITVQWHPCGHLGQRPANLAPASRLDVLVLDASTSDDRIMALMMWWPLAGGRSVALLGLPPISAVGSGSRVVLALRLLSGWRGVCLMKKERPLWAGGLPTRAPAHLPGILLSRR